MLVVVQFPNWLAMGFPDKLRAEVRVVTVSYIVRDFLYLDNPLGACREDIILMLDCGKPRDSKQRCRMHPQREHRLIPDLFCMEHNALDIPDIHQAIIANADAQIIIVAEIELPYGVLVIDQFAVGRPFFAAHHIDAIAAHGQLGFEPLVVDIEKAIIVLWDPIFTTITEVGVELTVVGIIG
jgi:hypothetical protein